MRRSPMFAVVLFGFMSLTGCTGAMNMMQPSVLTAAPGFIVTDVQGGTLVLDNGVAATKEGRACSTEIIGLVAQGDNRIETAMNNGGIKKLVFVNHAIKSYFFGVWAEVCTLARGN